MLRLDAPLGYVIVQFPVVLVQFAYTTFPWIHCYIDYIGWRSFVQGQVAEAGGGPQWEIAGCSGLQRQRAASGSNSGRRHLMAAAGDGTWIFPFISCVLLRYNNRYQGINRRMKYVSDDE